MTGQYDNPDLLVYLQDLKRLVRDDSERYEDRKWAEGIIRKFKENEYRREDFILICGRLDRI